MCVWKRCLVCLTFGAFDGILVDRILALECYRMSWLFLYTKVS